MNEKLKITVQSSKEYPQAIQTELSIVIKMINESYDSNFFKIHNKLDLICVGFETFIQIEATRIADNLINDTISPILELDDEIDFESNECYSKHPKDSKLLSHAKELYPMLNLLIGDKESILANAVDS